MKLYSINLDSNVIELHNNLLGRETVYFNGQKVSSAFSIFGSTHAFRVNGDDWELRVSTGMFGLGINLSKNHIPIIEAPSSQFLRNFLLLVAIMVLAKIIYSLING